MSAGTRLREAHLERNALLRIDRLDTNVLRWLMDLDSIIEAARHELDQRQRARNVQQTSNTCGGDVSAAADGGSSRSRGSAARSVHP
jgi:hypothetical protein